MRRGVCLLSSECGAADTVDLSSFHPPLICVPAPRSGRLIVDRKGRAHPAAPPRAQSAAPTLRPAAAPPGC